VTSNSTSDGSGAGAIILGDALHAFPPDLGQGVNSALQDVMGLQAALEAEGDDSPQRVAKHFENQRLPEAKALVKMMQVGAPFQYSQSIWRSKLWTLCFLVRVMLNKLMPSIFDKPVALQVQNPEMSYSEGWRRASRGAQRTCLLLGLLVFATGRLIVG
jgi:2-polyprenyl-6-methoxyphenol hydroxylase-like FAD-dependent oxidoreductase